MKKILIKKHSKKNLKYLLQNFLTAGFLSYKNRKKKKKFLKNLTIKNINFKIKQKGFFNNYSSLIYKLKQKSIELNKIVLKEIVNKSNFIFIVYNNDKNIFCILISMIFLYF